MGWLRPNEFFAGALSDVTETSLVLGRTNNSYNFLVGVGDQGKIAVALGERGDFRCFECSENYGHGGIIIPNPIFELHPDSLTEDYDYPVGSMLRRGDKLFITNRVDRFGLSTEGAVELQNNLPAGGGVAAFARWRVIIESDQQQTVLYSHPKVDQAE